MFSPESGAESRRRFPGRGATAGLFFMAAGLAGLWIGRNLNVGTADAMAEGYFPRAMCILLLVIGATILATALRHRDREIGWVALRPLVAVTASIIAFAIGLERLGLALTVLVSVAIANLAGRPMRILPLLALVTVLAVSIAAIFVWGLGLPLRLLPRWHG